MPTPLNSKPEPKITCQRKNHAIRKSRSVGGDIITGSNFSRQITATPSLEAYVEEQSDATEQSVSTRAPAPSTGLIGRKHKIHTGNKKGLGNLLTVSYTHLTLPTNREV